MEHRYVSTGALQLKHKFHVTHLQHRRQPRGTTTRRRKADQKYLPADTDSWWSKIIARKRACTPLVKMLPSPGIPPPPTFTTPPLSEAGSSGYLYACGDWKHDMSVFFSLHVHNPSGAKERSIQTRVGRAPVNWTLIQSSRRVTGDAVPRDQFLGPIPSWLMAYTWARQQAGGSVNP